MANLNNNNEVWIPLPINNYYLISTMGRIKGRNGKILSYEYRYRVNKFGVKVPQSVRVYLLVNGKQKKIILHRLVMQSFCPNVDKVKNTVDHIDRNPFNNALINLRWATQKEQSQNSVRYKLNRIKFTMDDLNNIFHRTKNETLLSISKDIGLISVADLSKLLIYMHPDY